MKRFNTVLKDDSKDEIKEKEQIYKRFKAYWKLLLKNVKMRFLLMIMGKRSFQTMDYK